MPFSEPQKHPLAKTATLRPSGYGASILLPSTKCFSETRILFGRPGSADSFGTIDVEPPIRTEQKPPVVRVDCLEMTCSAIGAAAAGVV